MVNACRVGCRATGFEKRGQEAVDRNRAGHAQADRALTKGQDRGGQPQNGPCAMSVARMHAGGASRRGVELTVRGPDVH